MFAHCPYDFMVRESSDAATEVCVIRPFFVLHILMCTAQYHVQPRHSRQPKVVQ
jgi:hypothetical protein